MEKTIRLNPAKYLDDFSEKAAPYRKVLDHLDCELLELLSRRAKVVEAIGKLKLEYGQEFYQPDRWNEIVSTWVKFGLELGLEKEFILSILTEVHDYSVSIQFNQANKKEPYVEEK